MPNAPRSTMDIAGTWIPSVAVPDHNLLDKWFSDLDSNSSTSWCSLNSSLVALQRLDTAKPAPLIHEPTSPRPSLLPTPSQPRSSKSMRHLRSKASSLISGKSRPTSPDKSYDQLVHTNREDGLFLMCKRGTEAESQDISSAESLEALPQCGGWDDGALSAVSSRSSNPGLLSLRSEVEIRRHSGEMGEKWKGRIRGLRKQGSQIFKKG